MFGLRVGLKEYEVDLSPRYLTLCRSWSWCRASSDQLGDLDRVARIVKLNGYVQCVDGYTGQPTVINGASDLLAEVLLL